MSIIIDNSGDKKSKRLIWSFAWKINCCERGQEYIHNHRARRRSKSERSSGGVLASRSTYRPGLHGPLVASRRAGASCLRARGGAIFDALTRLNSLSEEERCGGRHIGGLRLHISPVRVNSERGDISPLPGERPVFVPAALYGRHNKDKQKSGGAWVLSCDSNFPMPPLSAARCRCGLVVLALRVRNYFAFCGFRSAERIHAHSGFPFLQLVGC